MAEFSTASILRLARRAAERLGTPAPGGGVSSDARAPLAEKRALVGALYAAHGPLGLLSVSDCVGETPEDAIALALTPASDMADLLDRWTRLEAYVHSRHRVRIDMAAPGSAEFEHISLVEDEPPLIAESLLVIGVLTGIAEQVGVMDLRVDIGSGPRLLRREGRWSEECERGARWSEVGWSPAVWSMRWAPEAERVETAPPAASDAGAEPGAAMTLAERLRIDVRDDPARRWSLAEVARRYGLSERSLQRRLRSEEARFSDVVGAARVACAARLLVESSFGAAEIGFASGFADQAHFTRSYRRATAFTPAAYRAAFASTSAVPSTAPGATPRGRR